MKKLLVLSILSVLVLLLPVIASACSSDRIDVSLNEEFTLPAGKTALINGERLTIKFVEVSGDSRCAKGAECVWAGEVTCLMLIKFLDSSSSLEFIQGGGTNNTFYDFNVYQIVFNVEPYPEIDKTIGPNDYRIVMKVTKSDK